MNKRETYKALLEGKKVACIDWRHECYIHMNKDGDIVDEEDEDYNLNGLATNFKLYTEPKEVELPTNKEINEAFNENGGIMASDLIMIIKDYIKAKEKGWSK